MRGKVLDYVWMIVFPDEQGVVYAIGTTRQEAWDQARKVLYGIANFDGLSQQQLYRQGYRAKKVKIVL